MTDEQLLEAIGSIRDDFILEGASKVERAGQKRSLLLKWGVAACLMLTVGLTAWRIAIQNPVQPSEGTTQPAALTTTLKNTAEVGIPEIFPESMCDRFPTLTLNGITYSAEGETDRALGQHLGTLTLSGAFGEARVTVYSLEGSAPEEAIGLRFAGSEVTYLYQKQSASTDTAD